MRLRYQHRHALLALVAGGLGFAAAGCGSGAACAVGLCDKPPPVQISLAVVAADFTGDGHVDVARPEATGIAEPGFVGVLLHVAASGRGYAPEVRYAVDKNPYGIAAADLDGDGLSDLITTSFSADSVSVLLNSRSHPGSFGAPTNLAAKFVSSVAAADMDGDGRPDLVIAANPLLLAVQQPGQPGVFAVPAPLYVNPSGKTFGAVALGDLDGDGLTDVVVADDDGVKVLFHAPQATDTQITVAALIFSNTRVGESPAVAIADIDGDGRNDLVITDPDGNALVVLLQDPAAAGHFLAPRTTTLPSGMGAAIAIADLNGDGLPDVVTSGSDGVAVFLQDPQRPGQFTPAQSYGAPLTADGVAIVDVDGDGLPDVVTSSGVSSEVVNGTLTTPPGVLYQDPAHPGHFLALANLQ